MGAGREAPVPRFANAKLSLEGGEAEEKEREENVGKLRYTAKEERRRERSEQQGRAERALARAARA